MTIRKILAVITLLGAANLAFAGKVAVLNLESALMQTQAAAVGFKELDAKPEFAQVLAQFESLQADVEALNKEAQSKGMTWSQEQVAEHQKKVQYLQADLKLAAQKIQAERGVVLGKVNQKYQAHMKGILDGIMKAEGIDLILQPQAIILALPNVDITMKVAQALDKVK